MTQLSTSPPASIRTEASYADLPTDHLSAGNGVEYAYRRYGANTRPLLFLQHFRGNLDSWDPALADQIARSRQVVCFDNTGVGGSGGATPRTVRQMALDAIEFLDALEVDDVDLLGFSLGSFVAQEVALIRPNLVKRMILASAAPQGASGMHGWAPDVISAVGAREVSPSGFLDVFYTQSATSRGTGMASLQRITARTKDRDETASWQTRLAQYDAVCTWGIPEPLVARAGDRHQTAGVRSKRRQRPDDSAQVLVSPGWVAPGRATQDLPRCRARVPFPAPRRVRCRHPGLPRRRELIADRTRKTLGRLR